MISANDDHSRSAPSTILAQRIAAALATEGLIDGATADALALRLAEGTVRAAEWEGVIIDPPASAPNGSDD